MEFKKKIKSLIIGLQEQNAGRSALDATPSSQLDELPKRVFSKEPINEFPNDPLADREAIESIEEIYFSDEDFDASLYELKNLGDECDQDALEETRNRLRRQLRAVSKKVSDLVLENHPAYQKELQRVMDLQESLRKGSVICTNGRKHLSAAKRTFTTASLGLLANYQKREKLVGLLKSLRTIKTLQRTDIRLREMLEEEDYAGAIQLCLECQKAASTFKHYKCISELSSKLQDTLELIEEALDVALSKTCVNFDTKHYEKVQMAYRLLGKTQTAMDQLHMHFTSAIHNTAFTIVLGYVELCSGTADTNFQKRQYSDLCRNVMPEVFTPCLIDLCKALWEVMKSYHLTIKWHDDHVTETNESGEAGGGSVEASFHRRYIKQKLEHGLGRIWQDVQQKVRLYLLSTDLSHFKFDEFIRVLDLINRLKEIGEEFCGSKSEALQESIRQQSINYIHNYHRARLDELRMFLENEGWELCPVKPGFTVVQLQEFRFLRPLLNKTRNDTEPPTFIQTAGDEEAGEVIPTDGYFATLAMHGNPFDIQLEDDEKEDVMATNGFSEPRIRQTSTDGEETDSDEDVPDELKRDFVDEQTGDTPLPSRIIAPVYSRKSSGGTQKLPPIITNTTLTVLRLFGKYLQMMNNLKPIAFDVLCCMSQLFDYYLYTVYSFFSTDTSEQSELSMGTRLRGTLRRIQDNLILEDLQPGAIPPSPDEVRDKVAHPHISPTVDLTSQNSLYGLAERIVAVESLVFLAEQLNFLQTYLESMIPTAKKAFLQQFYSQTVGVTYELRNPVYRSVACQAVDFDQLLQMMASVKWDLRDIMSQHSGYVDVVLREFEIVSEKLSQTSRRVPVPDVVVRALWEHCIKLTNGYFVEGYAGAKKCSNEGRALMQLDFQQFLMQLEKLTNIRPIPEREFVEGYIKAYYLPEEQLEFWMKDHKEYSFRQLSALVNCVAHINKKSRQRLINVIEELNHKR